MAKSMTAFARVELNNISWEIRSVNQRYLDVSFRMPEPFRSTEITLKNSLRQLVHRGKIDCSLWVSKEKSQTSLSVDDQLVASLLSATKQINPSWTPQKFKRVFPFAAAPYAATFRPASFCSIRNLMSSTLT